MEIVQKEIKGTGVPIRISVLVHVDSLAIIPVKEVVEHLISGVDEEDQLIMYLEEPVSGKVFLRYPLSVIVQVDIDKEESIGGILWTVAKAYEEIYIGEKETSRIEELPIEERGNLINRNTTDGIYGVYGHDIYDLYFESIEIYPNGVIDIFVGS